MPLSYSFESLVGELVSLFEREEDKVAVSLFINFLRQLTLYGTIKQEDYAELERVYRSSEEVKSMLVTTLERQRAKYRQEDLQKGEWHRALKVACRMLDQNYAPTVIADLAQLSLDEVTQVQTVHTMLGQGIELSGIASQTQLAPDMVEQIYLEESKISSAATSK